MHDFTRPTDLLLEAYRDGVFPMADSAEDDAFAFYKPYRRGILPIEGLHIPAKLSRALHKQPYSVTVNRAFTDVIDGCAAATPKRSKTWINRPIRDLFIALHHEGHAHSVECWTKDGKLAGGLYGLAIGAVFCGESMFSNETDASKIALVHLCAILSARGFTVLDTQFINPHLLQFGAYEMDQADYESLIATEMEKRTYFPPSGEIAYSVIEEYLAKRPEDKKTNP